MTSPAEQAASDKADFCLRLGIAPSEYDGLTDTEVTAFITEYNKILKE